MRSKEFGKDNIKRLKNIRYTKQDKSKRNLKPRSPHKEPKSPFKEPRSPFKPHSSKQLTGSSFDSLVTDEDLDEVEDPGEMLISDNFGSIRSLNRS